MGPIRAVGLWPGAVIMSGDIGGFVVTGTLTTKPEQSNVGVGRMAGVPFSPNGRKRKT